MTHYKVLCLILSGATRADITKVGLSENRGFKTFFFVKNLAVLKRAAEAEAAGASA